MVIKCLHLQKRNNMAALVTRNIQNFIIQNLQVFPAVVILGSRQCGKSTLIKMMSEQIGNYLYLDLQNRSDLAKLSEPELFFDNNADKTICLDEIQLRPDLFSILRSIIDRDRRNGRFILLGSASRDLVQHTTETLAGRVGLIDLTPFMVDEICNRSDFDIKKYWFRGGYPDSYNADSDEASALWRENFIRTYIERDIPQLGFQIAAPMLMRMLSMTAHEHGAILNLAKFASSLGVTAPTVRHYFDIMEQTYIVRTLQPYFANTKKRLVKSPKIYIRDSGILHQILQLPSFNELMGHTIFGNSWEGMVVENVCAKARNAQCCFYRSATGEEMDLVLLYPNATIAIECKSSASPTVQEGFWKAIEFLKPTKTFVVAPVDDSYFIAENVEVCNPQTLLGKL